MMSLRDKDSFYATKQEDDTTKESTGAASSSRQWSSGHKNPRIVRVSRTFGGKDRHSKVCTIKGLRDRRIRLSVPTAIQLYDLQDRLGLSQPSKVIDWLLDNTKNDIDKLPPLPPMPGTFPPFHQGMHSSHGYGGSLGSSTQFIDSSFLPSRKEGIKINSQSVDGNEVEDQSLLAKLKYWDSNAIMRSKKKEVSDDQDAIGNNSSGSNLNNSQISAQNFFPIASGNNTSILPHPPNTLLSNHPMFNYYHWEPSNLSLTQLGSLGLSSHQNEANNQGHSSSSSSLPSPLALSSGSQLYLSPSMPTSSLFPPHASFLTNSHQHQVENDIRQLNRFHMLNNNPLSSSLYNSSGSGLRPFPFSVNHHPHSHQSNDNREDKDDDHTIWKDSSTN